jgi:glycosyltransferase involved in cell wall biosynthesis
VRILHAFPFLSVKRGGGTVKLLRDLARAQSLRGHSVTIYTGDWALERDDVTSLAGVRVRAFRSWMNFGFYIAPALIGAARSEISGFDVVHMHLYRSFQNVVLHRFARKAGVPYIVDAHGSLTRLGRKGRLKAAFDRWPGGTILRDARYCVGETELGVREYIDLGVPPERVVRIPPPFPVEEFADLPERGLFRARHGFVDSERIVMFLGRIHWIKGIDLLTESFARLASRRRDVRLVIVGPDDGYRSELEALIAGLKLHDRVSFTGFLGGREKLSALVDADVVVQTSRYEQGAWAPIEAVLCGTPIVVSDNSGAGEDVRRMNAGYLVRFGDLDDLAGAIGHVLDNRAEAITRTLAARDFVEKNLSMAAELDKYEHLYDLCRT